MRTDENRPPTPQPALYTRQLQDNALALGPRKRPSGQDPYVGHGRHFGRTIHALCRVKAVINNGLFIQEKIDLNGQSLEDLLAEYAAPDSFTVTAQQYAIFEQLTKLTPNLRETIFTSSEEEVARIADLLQKGANGARSDDTKSLKGAVIEWITPKGQALTPPLTRNVKIDRGYHHERTGSLLCPTGLNWQDSDIKEKLRSGELLVSGDEWPVFVYHEYTYDPEDPWNGAFRSLLLVKAFKHVFTSPSSVDKDPKATRSGNARLHDMISVTPASIAYIATQVRFSLCSSSIFSRTDNVTDSERFYSSVLETFMDPEENDEVNKLVDWWNRQIFPGHLRNSERLVNKDSALARIKARRAQRKALRDAQFN
ncbi:hypothetical protein DXG01_017226 [Tephrocybe rancida]|nr:hypothetical protein DXG01_017226 [Tephrocybe rancida]